MCKENKFRAWDGEQFYLIDLSENFKNINLPYLEMFFRLEKEQYTNFKDKEGNEIYEGDIIEFTDKWEWYRGKYAVSMMFADNERKKQLEKEYNEEKMYRIEVKFPSFFEISKSDLKSYWKIVGNIHENPELLSE
jgi:uncharacterized phage protein (TIGR01671 family)